MIRIRHAARATLCVAVLASCVKISDDNSCGPLFISPGSTARFAGTPVVFSAKVGELDTPCTWTVVPGTGVVLQAVPGQPGSLRVITSSPTNYRVQATSNIDPTLSCSVLLSLVSLSVSGGQVISVAGGLGTFIEGDVAIGGSSSLSLFGPGSGGGTKVYVATVRNQANTQGDNNVTRYALADLVLGMPVVEYQTPAVASTGFGQFTRPEIAADTDGNAYWFKNASTIARVDADQSSGEPETRPIDTIPGLMPTFLNDIHADAQGRLYWYGGYLPTGGTQSTGILRVAGLFGGPQQVTPVITGLSFKGQFAFTVDSGGRILLAIDGFFGRYRANGTLDATFALAPALTSTEIVNIRDIDTDGQGLVYVTLVTFVSQQFASEVRVYNEFGTEVRRFTQSSPPGAAALDSVLGLGVSANGTLVFFDDTNDTVQAGAIFVLSPDDPANLPPPTEGREQF